MDEALTIRFATPEDFGIVQQLATTIWNDHYPSIISQGQIDYMLARDYSVEALTMAHHAGTLCWLAEFREKPIGFATSYLESISRAKLAKLYLDVEAHGRGFGQVLLQSVISHMATLGASTLALNVNKRNAKAIRAYERAGFYWEASIIEDIGGGYVVDDFVLIKDI